MVYDMYFVIYGISLVLCFLRLTTLRFMHMTYNFPHVCLKLCYIQIFSFREFIYKTVLLLQAM